MNPRVGTYYEFVWTHKGKIYLYTHNRDGEDVSPICLPEELDRISKFLDKKNIPWMVYRIPAYKHLYTTEAPDIEQAYCCHCNAEFLGKKGKDGFGNAEKWLKKKGFNLK